MNTPQVLDIVITLSITSLVLAGSALFMLRRGWLPTPIVRRGRIKSRDPLQHEKDLLRRMEKLAFPETDDSPFHRDLSTWSRVPLKFRDSLLSTLAVSATPH